MLVTGNAVNTANQTVAFRGQYAETNVAQITGDGAGLTGTTPAVATATSAVGDLFNAPHVDARRSVAQHQRPARQGPADQRHGGRLVHEPDRQPVPRVRGPGRQDAARDLRHGLPQPVPDPGRRERRRVRDGLLAGLADTPQNFRGPAGIGRVEIVRQPSNYGWPICQAPNLPFYKWNFNPSTPLNPASPERVRVRQPGARPGEHVALEHRPDGDAADHAAGHLVLVPRQPGRVAAGHAVPGLLRRLGRHLPAALPRARATAASDRTGRRSTPTTRPTPTRRSCRRTTTTRCSSASSRGTTCARSGWTRDNKVFKINSLFDCGAVAANSAFQFECDNPMDLQFGPDGTFYLLTYGDGFFAANADAGMYKWEYVKGQRAPQGVLSTQPDQRSRPADGGVLLRRLAGSGPRRRADVRVGLRRQRHGRLDRPESDPHVHDAGSLHRQADGEGLKRQVRLEEHGDHRRQQRAA